MSVAMCLLAYHTRRSFISTTGGWRFVIMASFLRPKPSKRGWLKCQPKLSHSLSCNVSVSCHSHPSTEAPLRWLLTNSATVFSVVCQPEKSSTASSHRYLL
ncbi:uncharacterized protein LY79DRAFT_534733 [Colletotrichum navitas]|uniref:Uncharacterized protein n=1 Tax=Colletotrichum navitas TaxID=681940 RepID=A0AAD8QDH0_9PEZI|nr:uncharacterized protein LY79DRAFT_534733 [Colletotrichum navitas]KAK1599308.1 hypothetical protein LY79DRAFT_534733 [Colletotrichum navitas]